RVLPSASRGSCWDRYSFPARRSSDLIGFCFAYAQARLQFRGKRLLHLIALLPIVSPPFAVATAVITLFGRSGLITNQLLGLEYKDRKSTRLNSSHVKISYGVFSVKKK